MMLRNLERRVSTTLAWFLESPVINGLVVFGLLLVLGSGCHMSCTLAQSAPRAASYSQQTSTGSPLAVGGKIDSAKVMALARFDDVVFNVTPWAQDVNGLPRVDATMLLRKLSPRTRQWLYTTMDPYLPQAFVPQPWDHSGYRDIFVATAAGNGFLYDTSGRKWWDGLANISLNAADYWSMWRIGDVLVGFARQGLWDGIFLDNLFLSVAWASNGDHVLDVERAGFHSLAAMDSARVANIELLIARLHEAGGCGFLVAVNGGPQPRPKGCDIDFREGLGYLPGSSVAEARRWMREPGLHWLSSGPGEDCYATRVLLRSIAAASPGSIISGNGGNWPPCPTYPDTLSQ